MRNSFLDNFKSTIRVGVSAIYGDFLSEHCFMRSVYLEQFYDHDFMISRQKYVRYNDCVFLSKPRDIHQNLVKNNQVTY